MEIAFVRTGESHDRVHVRRDDGSTAGWRWPAGGPPHDLIHWVVEDSLDFERGFWGLVGAGGEPRSLDSGPELMRAEAVVNSIQQGRATEPAMDDAECLRWAATWAEQAGVDLPDGVDLEGYRELRARAEDWIARYRDLEAGAALHVAYPSASRRSEAARSGG